MEIKELILLFLRNIRYIVLGLVLGASLGFVVSIVQSPVYEATTKVFVSQVRQQSNPDMLSLSDEQLLAIILQLAKSQPVLNDVSSQLGSKIDTDNIQISTIPNSLIIQIKVQDGDSLRAAAIANLLAITLIDQNEALLSERYVALETSINEQADQVQSQIESMQTQANQISDTDIQEQLASVKKQIDAIKSENSSLEKEIAGFSLTPTPVELVSLAEKRARLDQLQALMTLFQQIQVNLIYIGKPGSTGSGLENPQLTTIQSTLNLYRQIYQTLITKRENIRLANTQSKHNVMQIVSATSPKTPTRPIPVLYVLLGGGVGLALATIFVLVIEQLVETVKTIIQAEKLLGIPVLGFVFDHKHDEKKMIVRFTSDSKEVDAFGALGANLEIAGIGKSIRSLMVVNAEPGTAKTAIAANLALINAQQGKKVILLDGDLKHPNIHNIFGIKNQKGFAELIDGRVDIQSANHILKDLAGMNLVLGGIAEKDLTGWMQSEKMTQLLSALLEKADIVIIDSPPADVADAQILASMMDAVLLLIEADHTHVDAAQATMRRFRSIGANMAGSVFYRTN